MGEWQPISTAPEGKRVRTCIDADGDRRNEAYLTRRGRLWFTDGPNSMYVYYTPTHWQVPA